jgi:CheY-like chemotaxis protein
VSPAAADVPIRREVRGYVGPRIKILAADDDPNHLDFVSRILQPLGFALFTASDGVSAVETAKEVRPDLALLDISMPGSSGWEVAAALRTLDLPKLKIIMVSANAHDYLDPTGDAAMHDGYLVKPLDIRLLLERIEALLGLQWIDEEPATAVPPAGIAKPVDYPADAKAHFAELLQLGRIGHVRGIERKLAEMESEDDVYEALVAELRHLVRGFELKRFVEVVDRTQAVHEQVHE